MLPPLGQRIFITIATILGGLVWLLALGPLAAVDGSGGLTLGDAHIGLPGAVGVILLAAIPAICLGLAASAIGNPLAGLFIVAGALMILAANAGPIDGLMWRSQLPDIYRGLIAETLFWTAAWTALLLAIQYLCPKIRTKIGPKICQLFPNQADESDYLDLGDICKKSWNQHTVVSGLVATAVSGFLCLGLIQSTAPGQVVGAMLLAFSVGALVSRMIVPQANALGILLSPAVVALLGYGYMLLNVQFVDTDAVLRTWYAGHLPGLALALPIHYASAAVAGCALGLGIAQSLETSRSSAPATSR